MSCSRERALTPSYRPILRQAASADLYPGTAGANAPAGRVRLAVPLVKPKLKAAEQAPAEVRAADRRLEDQGNIHSAAARPHGQRPNRCSGLGPGAQRVDGG